MNNNTIGIKLFFQTLLGVADNQKLTATEFNTLPAWQNSPVQQIAGSLDDTDIIIDGTKNYATTIVVTGSTRTITANASGHLQGNNIKQRYQYNQDCTLTLTNFDDTGNNTGTIAPIPAGTYDFKYIANRNGRNLEIAQNIAAEASPKTEPSTWYVHSAPKGDDSNVGSDKFPFLTIQHAHDTAEENDAIVIQDIFFEQPSSPGTSITKSLIFKGVTANISSFTQLRGTWTITSGKVVRFENIGLFFMTLEGSGNFTIYLTNCSTNTLKTGASRFAKIDAQSSIIDISTPANYRTIVAYNCKIVGDLSIGFALTLYDSLLIGDCTTGLDSGQPMTLYNSTIQGDVIVTASSLSKFNSVITGTETVSGTTTEKQQTQRETIKIPLGARTTDHTTGTNKVGLHIDYDFTFIGLPTLEFDPIITDGGPTGTSFIVDINVADIDGANEATILSTKLSVDAGEFHSSTAATPAVLSSNTIAQYKFISIDIDQIGGTLAGKGGYVTLNGFRT